MNTGSLGFGPENIRLSDQLHVRLLEEENYKAQTELEMSSLKPLKASYVYNTESQAWRITKFVLSIIIFPIALYNLIHALIGKAVVIASRPTAMGPEYAGNYALDCRENLHPDWKYKRFTVQVDGTDIDAYIITKPNTVNNGRWMLNSNGVGQFAEERCFRDMIVPPDQPVQNEGEDKQNAEAPQPTYRATYRELMGHEFRQILTSLESNAIVFNYPNVGSSGGMPNRNTMVKAYKAMLTILEDQTIGLGAKEIIGYGHSIGGGVQGDALRTHELKNDIKYAFVKSRTFSNLSTASSCLASHMAGRIAGYIAEFFIKCFGWNLDSVESSLKLNAPEIILQTATMPNEAFEYEELLTHEDANKIASEEAIRDDASIAKALLTNPDWDRTKKRIFGIRQTHSQPIQDISFLTDAIHRALA